MTTPSLFDHAALIALVSVLASVSSLLVGTLTAIRLKRNQDRSAALLHRFKEDVHAARVDADDLGARLTQLQQQLQHLTERQEQWELRDRGGYPYQQAIRMVQKGAQAEELVSVCGLSRPEASLIVMLHGVKKAG